MLNKIFDKVFNFKNLDEKKDGLWPKRSCDNCLNRDIRISTVCSWCAFKWEPVGFSICDLHEKDWNTNRIMWHLAYNHWEDSIQKKLKNIIESSL